LIVEGTNPIKVIYDHFSAGVHKLDEETAVQVADNIASALERVRGAVGPLPRQASYVIHRST
jgi:peptide subunit release factor RF-3